LYGRIIKNIILGVFDGVVYYVLFFVVIPEVFSRTMNMPIEPPPLLIMLMLGIFIAFGVISASVNPFIGIVFEVMSVILGALVLLMILGGKFATSIEYGEISLEISVEFKPLIFIIVGFSVLYAIMRCFERLSHLAKE